MAGTTAGMALVGVALLPLFVVLALFMPSAPGGAYQRWTLRLGPLSAAGALLTVSLAGRINEVTVPWLFLGARLGLDSTGAVFLMATSFVWGVAAVFAYFSRGGFKRRRQFFQFFYTAMAGNFLLIVAADMITFLAGFTMMSLAGFGLVVHKRDPESRRAARIYIVLVVLGEVTLFAGAVLAWAVAGSLDLDAVRIALGHGEGLAVVSMALLFCGFGIKAGMMPLHVWLPLAHPAAPIPASAVLSAAMIKAGLLGWMRFLPFGVEGLAWLGWWALIAGLIAAFVGVLFGLLQSHPKTILAYSSISQMGYMTILLGVSAIYPELASAVTLALLVYVVHHALAKGALFLSIHVARAAPESRAWAILEGAGLVIPALALAGAPLTTGAVAKHELKALPYVGEVAFPAWLDPALVAGGIATTVLMARFLWVMWPRARRKEPISSVARAVWLLLATAVVWSPWLVPWAHFRRSAAAALEWEALWSAFWPLLIGAALVVVVFRHRHIFPLAIHDKLPAGDLVVPVEALLRKVAYLWRKFSTIVGRRWTIAWLDAMGWIRSQRRLLDIARSLEERAKRQAWDWLWILLVGALLLVALLR